MSFNRRSEEQSIVSYLHTWWSVWCLIVIALVQQWMMYTPFTPTRWLGGDPTLFMYGGNLLARGYSMYVYLWDVKPPAVYETMALVALIAPNDIGIQYYISSYLTSLMALVTIVVAGTIVYRYTESHSAVFLTGIVIFAYPRFLMLPQSGIWAKHFAIAFGLCAVYLTLNERYVIAGLLAALAAGYWQWAIIFPVLVLIHAYQHDEALSKPVGAMGIAVIVVITPIVLLGGGEEMIRQAVFGPFAMSQHTDGLLSHTVHFIHLVPYSWPLFYGALFGGVWYARTRLRESWWYVLLLAWGTFQIGFLDFDSYPDPMLLVVVLAIGAGLFVGTLSRDQQVALLCISITFAGGQVYDERKVFEHSENATFTPGDVPRKQALAKGVYPPHGCKGETGWFGRNRRLTNPPFNETCHTTDDRVFRFRNELESDSDHTRTVVTTGVMQYARSL